jgi:hypothetical protein
MRTHFYYLFFLLTLLAGVRQAAAQGALNPPGAPAPTMKTADQIYAKLDPRIPVSTNTTPGDASDTFIISQPGSYYLTTNIVGIASENGIEILANNVTLDLNGFTVRGVAPASQQDLESVADSGIFINGGYTNVIVRNGIIIGWPSFYAGVSSPSAASQNIVFERLTVSGSYNGGGILIGGSGVVRDCNCLNNYGNGIECDGGGVVSGCTANNNAEGIYGYSAHFACLVSGCVVQNNEIGIDVSPATVSGCLVQRNTVVGIFVDGNGSRIVGNDCVVNNSSNSSTDAAIEINDNGNQVEANRITGGYGGILVTSGNVKNVVIKNSAAVSAGLNFSVPSGNDLGPVGTAATSTSPWANISN